MFRDHIAIRIFLFYSSEILNDMEFACYCHWFDHLIQQNPPKLDLIGEFYHSRTVSRTSTWFLFLHPSNSDHIVCCNSLPSLFAWSLLSEIATKRKEGGETGYVGECWCVCAWRYFYLYHRITFRPFMITTRNGWEMRKIIFGMETHLSLYVIIYMLCNWLKCMCVLRWLMPMRIPKKILRSSRSSV